ncbi:MAG: magnesium chelatase [Candidatus Sumerlaeia bacterium]|nr:magnesium chelatase [Candidatus Sumerlaeia bacterium]
MSAPTEHKVPDHLPKTLGALKAANWPVPAVKDELRKNLIAKLRAGETIFPGIIGYDKTVVPQITAAILSKHDFLLLGLRGQAKTRLIRQLVHLLDEWMPVIKDSPINESPYAPLTKQSRELLRQMGADAPVDWVHRSRRYQEKLATPDVSIADLIGDIDPIKAVARKLDFSDEDVIHFGLVPRSNRGIFAINELPDLQARIQVGLLNIMEEKDIQIRGFPVRLPLDVALVFTANPEDYTNRGNIITPLKDRINAQILTHYPEKLEDALAITAQEAWTERGLPDRIHPLLHELVEQVVVEARKSDYVDRNSGVSARVSISYVETLHSVAEARAHRHGEAVVTGRISDLYESITALTGKIELVYKGEQEGITNVAFHLVGRAVKEAFNKRYAGPMSEPTGRRGKKGADGDFSRFQPIIDWFEGGKHVELASQMSFEEYGRTLRSIGGLEKTARDLAQPKDDIDLLFAMEFILDGLHQNFLLTKHVVDARIRYTDTVSYMMNEVSD